MNSPRVGAASITLPNGLTLIAGGGRCVEGQAGVRSCTATNTAQLYDPRRANSPPPAPAAGRDEFREDGA